MVEKVSMLMHDLKGQFVIATKNKNENIPVIVELF